MQRQKAPLIPPLLIDDKFVSYIEARSNIFNKFFADQCTLSKNNSMFLTQAKLGSLDLNEGEVFKLGKVLNINKAHGNDDIFIRMIKIYDESLVKPLFIFI